MDFSKWSEIEKESFIKNGCRFWSSNNNPVPKDLFVSCGIEYTEEQRIGAEKHTTAFLERYRKQQENRVYSPEELAEMKNSFGEDAIVVNVVTGKKINL